MMLALLVSLLRFGSPWLAALQQQWLDRLLSEHQLTLNIGGLGLGWQDFGPVLVLEDVRLQRPQQPDLILRRASVDMQLWQSLRQWRPVLNELTLDGLRLTLGLSGEGEAPRTDITALRTLALQGVERLSLVDAQLVLASPGKPLLELNIPALRWYNGAELHQGEGRLSFGPGAGQQFVFQGRLEGPIDRLSGGIYLQADRVDASPVLARVRPEDDSVSAELSFEAWLEWRQGELQAALLTLGQNRAGWGEGHEVVVKGVVCNGNRPPPAGSWPAAISTSAWTARPGSAGRFSSTATGSGSAVTWIGSALPIWRCWPSGANTTGPPPRVSWRALPPRAGCRGCVLPPMPTAATGSWTGNSTRSARRPLAGCRKRRG
ncbi:hypothetical protein MBH78_09345 [Oceanimonas sp. NS1]|nr:hypothetical protein [Oceanimonas sp. NS1]